MKAIAIALLMLFVGLLFSIMCIKLVSLTPDWFIDWLFTFNTHKKKKDI